MRVLIVEDEKEVAETLKDELKRSYIVDVALTGEEGEYLAHTNTYDAITLDITLPDTSGITICRDLRNLGLTTPILVLTGKNDTKDIVSALDSGADDYLSKPFSFEELEARLRALMRRNTSNGSSIQFTVGDLCVDIASRTVHRGDVCVTLRRKEFELLEYLVRNRGNLVTRSMILDHVWEESSDMVSNVVDVHIKYLRDRVDKPFNTQLIKTIHGLGYKIET